MTGTVIGLRSTAWARGQDRCGAVQRLMWDFSVTQTTIGARGRIQIQSGHVADLGL